MENSGPKIIDVSARWVSEGLEPYFRDWVRYNPVLVSAQTGQGKNHFIMKSLIPHACQTNQHVVLLSNRVALSAQQKVELLHTLKMPRGVYSDDELIKKEEFGPVTVWSYQAVLQRLPRLLKQADAFSPHGYLILDEAHFFLSDAPFNAETETIFKSLLRAFRFYKRIYMSATPDDILPVISYLENSDLTCRKQLELFDISTPVRPISHQPVNDSLCIYQFPRNYSCYNIQFFSSMTELPEIINRRPKDEKWLCFINNKEQQKTLSRSIKKETKHAVNCFDSSLKSSANKVWKKLITGSFPGDVLLTTSVIDNGVNITDTAVKNIVIEAADKVSFLQMLGRRRIALDESINVFVCVPDAKTIKYRLQHIDDLLKIVQVYRQNPRHFLSFTWEKLDNDARRLFFVTASQHIVLNNFASHQLDLQLQFYSNLLYRMEIAAPPTSPDEIYPETVLEWLGLSSKTQWENSAVTDASYHQLTELLNSYPSCGVPPEDQDNFYKTVFRLLKLCRYIRPTARDDKRSPVATLNRHFEQLALSYPHRYQIDKKNNHYIISCVSK